MDDYESMKIKNHLPFPCTVPKIVYHWCKTINELINQYQWCLKNRIDSEWWPDHLFCLSFLLLSLLVFSSHLVDEAFFLKLDQQFQSTMCTCNYVIARVHSPMTIEPNISNDFFSLKKRGFMSSCGFQLMKPMLFCLPSLRGKMSSPCKHMIYKWLRVSQWQE